MKKFFVSFATVVMAIALIGLNSCNKEAQSTDESPVQDSIVSGVSSEVNHIKIAYFDMPRYISEYKPAVKAMEDLRNEQAKAEKGFQDRQAKLEKEAATFQEKMNNNAFLSQASAESQYNELQQKSQKLQQDAARKEQELLIKSQQLEKQYADTLLNYLKEFNADGKYELILDKAAILTAVGGYDITDEVLENLNMRAAVNE